MDLNIDSKTVSRAAVQMAISESREVERTFKEYYKENEMYVVAVDVGGDYFKVLNKMVEQALVASKREGLITDTHHESGAVAGALRDALSQVMTKASGMNVGGKIGLARGNDHLSVAVFLSIGLLHLDEIALGLAHRTI